MWKKENFPGSITLSEVVTLKLHEEMIAEITLTDKKSHNTFSAEFIRDLTAVFQNLPAQTKVVILHGYDNYFCCGGTQTELLDLAEGKNTFNDHPFYRILLDCELPTIAAMQGHALGGGLVLGCYADIIILAEESLYSANFMKYGFTPGMGATYILPKKLGETLANEMMFSARNYHGEELGKRNGNIKVVKKENVIKEALILAKEIAEKPLPSLKLLKKQCAQSIKKALPLVIEQELAMHEISFRLPEVKENIKKLFFE